MILEKKEVQVIFFEAMLAEHVKLQEPNFGSNHGSNSFTFEKEEFKVVDEWDIGPDLGNGSHGNYSSGQIVITFNKRCVWKMSYQGLYGKEVIPFLHGVLYQAYQQRRFIGGRGPLVVQDGQFIYTNRPDRGSTFEYFSGREEIYSQVVEGQRGWHDYQGMLMIS